MTLAALRHKIGNHDFAVLLRTWAREHRYGNVTTAQFVNLAERVSGQRLGSFFYAWLWRPAKPPTTQYLLKRNDCLNAMFALESIHDGDIARAAASDVSR